MTINADAYWADKYRISHFSTTAIYQVIQYVHKYKVEVISMMAGNQLKTAHKTILPNHFGRGWKCTDPKVYQQGQKNIMHIDYLSEIF